MANERLDRRVEDISLALMAVEKTVKRIKELACTPGTNLKEIVQLSIELQERADDVLLCAHRDEVKAMAREVRAA